MHFTVAAAPLAARPERRPRAPGRAWSEGHLCAADDSTLPTAENKVKELAGYLHIINVVAVDARGGHCYNLALIMLSSLYT